MQKLIVLTCLAAFVSLLNGCVTRTVSESISNRGQTTGSNPQGKVLSEKRIWVWQKEFRNP